MFGTQKQKKKVRGDKATGRDRGGGGGRNNVQDPRQELGEEAARKRF